jgi:dsDNA-binding SOS-regulon protein
MAFAEKYSFLNIFDPNKITKLDEYDFMIHFIPKAIFEKETQNYTNEQVNEGENEEVNEEVNDGEKQEENKRVNRDQEHETTNQIQRTRLNKKECEKKYGGSMIATTEGVDRLLEISAEFDDKEQFETLAYYLVDNNSDIRNHIIEKINEILNTKNGSGPHNLVNKLSNKMETTNNL